MKKGTKEQLISSKIQNVFIFLIFALGLTLVFYPKISNWHNERVGSYVVLQYDEIIIDKNNEEYDEMFQKAREYNDTIVEYNQFINGEVLNEEYAESLNVLNSMIGYLEIDELKIRLPIYHGTSETVLQKAVGHLEGSHLPTGDIGNSTVLTGHTGLPTANLLTNIVNMEIGDTFKINVLNEIFLYEVFAINVVNPDELDFLSPIDDIDMVTLITCTPYGINSHRLLVHGKQIEYDKDTDVQTPSLIPPEFETEENDISHIIPYIITVIMVILILALILSKFLFIYYVIGPYRVDFLIYEIRYKGKIYKLYTKRVVRK